MCIRDRSIRDNSEYWQSIRDNSEYWQSIRGNSEYWQSIRDNSKRFRKSSLWEFHFGFLASGYSSRTNFEFLQEKGSVNVIRWHRKAVWMPFAGRWHRNRIQIEFELNLGCPAARPRPGQPEQLNMDIWWFGLLDVWTWYMIFWTFGCFKTLNIDMMFWTWFFGHHVWTFGCLGFWIYGLWLGCSDMIFGFMTLRYDDFAKRSVQ